MPSKRHPSLRSYTPDERVALATEIDRRYRAGEGSIREIAEKLGTTDSNFYNWRRAGLIAQPVKTVTAKPKVQPQYSPDDRVRLLTEVERLRGAGQALEAACKAVGIAETTWRKWREAAAPVPAMRPVEVQEVTALVPVAPAPPPALSLAPPRPAPGREGPIGLVLVAPGGYHIEGLSVETAAALLNQLEKARALT